MHKALTIGGSDSGGGAGIQADLKTFAAHGVYGCSAITAVTAQNTVGVTALLSLPADIVTAQIEAVIGDIDIDVVKTGMLANAAIVEAVAAAIRTLDMPKLVVDPVMVAKSGHHLLSDDAVATMKTELLPLAHVVTPNVPEAVVLAGISIQSLEDASEAARRIHDLGPAHVLVKGGHLTGPDAVDVLYDGRNLVYLSERRLDSTNTHGTGCTLASAIAANLALRHDLGESATRAKRYVAEAIREGLSVGRGYGVLDHFFRWR